MPGPATKKCYGTVASCKRKARRAIITKGMLIVEVIIVGGIFMANPFSAVTG